MTNNGMRFEVNLYYDNYIVRDHRVLGLRVLPGVVLVETIYRMLEAEFSEDQIVLKNIVFKEPIVLTENFDIKIIIEVYKTDVTWKITINTYKMKKNNIIDNTLRNNFECELNLEKIRKTETKLDVNTVKKLSHTQFEIDKVYAAARNINIIHENFMKANGKIFQTDDAYLAEVTLDPLAKKYLGHFYIHPVYLDAATLIASEIHNKQLEKPYIPMFIREFKIIKNSTPVCYIYSLIKNPKNEFNQPKDIMIRDLEGYDENGNLIFLMKELTVKQIRLEDSIKKLTEVKTNLISSFNDSTQIKYYKSGNLIIDDIINTIAELTHKQISRSSLNTSFYDLGLDSLELLKIIKHLEGKLKIQLYPTLLFEYNTIEKFAKYLEKHVNNELSEYRIKTKDQIVHDREKLLDVKFSEKDIAIIGLSGIYPGAENLDQFWENLKLGIDSIIEIPNNRWNHSIYYNKDKNQEGKCYGKWGGFINDVDKFDPLFFNIAPNEAELMDPQERLFLETVWHAFEDSGYTKDDLAKKTVGVFVGLMYGQYQLFSAEEIAKGNILTADSFYSSVANRVSYSFDFNGPSIALDTMCSSSLTTIHLACKSIINGECQLAVAGGVNVSIHPYKYLLLSQKQFLSSDGHCRSFGEGGDGYVPGEGVGAIILKPLTQAIKDNDHIYGVIKASAINHGGKSAGYTKPNPAMQAKIIEQAINEANIESHTVNYIEAHGTGTSLGDPIEIDGLSKVYTKQDKYSCSIGSVKSNIGHLESAAGIAAVTKVLLQLQQRQLVPSLHSKMLNPNINFSMTPFKVQQILEEWKPIDGYPLRAGISSFGAGGSNAHVIIEEAPALPEKDSIVKPAYLFTLSAKSEYSLKEKIKELSLWLEGHDEPIQDISFTLNAGRSHFDLRCALVASSKEELIDTLEKLTKQEKVKNAFINFTPVEEQDDAVIYKKVFKQIMQELSDSTGEEYRDNLLALAKFYTKGYDLDWEALHQGESKRRVSLPGYPFVKKRCWVKKNVEAVEPPLPSPLLQQKTLEKRENTREEVQDVVGELYDEVFLESKDKAVTPLYLTFGPLREIIPGFSWSSSFLSGEQQNIMINAQREMRDILFRRVDFNECQKVLDFGCGYGNDLIQLALDYPHLQLCGYTISKEQAWTGNNSVKKNNLTDRVTIYHRDSAVEAFPDNYDVIFGFEVAHHVKNKDALFENISQHLSKTGKLILADFISHEAFPIEHEKTSSYFITSKTWADLLTAHHMQLVECIDISKEVSNFLHDDQFEKNFAAIINPAVREAFMSYHQLEKLLRERMASYVLLTAIPASSDMTDAELRHYNEDILRYAIPYKEISDEKRWFYRKVWKKKEVTKPGDASAKKRVIITNKENEKLAENLKKKLSAKVFSVENDKMNKGEWINLLEHIRESVEFQGILFLNTLTEGNRVMPDASVSERSGIQSLSQQKSLDARSLADARVWHDTDGFEKNSLKMLGMLQAIAATYSQNPPKLWFVTQEGALNQSAIPAMAKTFALEMPNFKCTSVSINLTEDDEKISKAIVATIGYDEGELLVDEEGIKVVVLEKLKVDDNQKINYEAASTVLITGAFGGLGMQVFHWYIKQGVKHFILLARHKPSQSIVNELNQYKEAGIQIVTAEVDVTDKHALENILQQSQTVLPALSHVVHVAGVIKDSAILNQTKENFEIVIRAKALGAWNLHELTKDQPLKEFVLFSSVAGVLGSPGQINYAAANAFLENLAKYRRSLNLPAKTIAWGAWGEVGMAAHMPAKAHLGIIKIGGYDIAPKQGIKAYALAQTLDFANIIIAPIDWERYQKNNPTVMPDASVASDLASREVLQKKTLDARSLATLASGMTEKFKPILRTYVSEITGIEPQDIKDKATFAEMGVDSVMGMKLRNRVQAHLGDQIKIPANAVYEYPTINDFAAYLGKETSTGPISSLPTESINNQKHFKFSELEDDANLTLDQEIVKITSQGDGVWNEGNEIVIQSLKPINYVPSKILTILEKNKKYFPLSSSQEVMCIQSELFKNLSYQLSAAFYIDETVNDSLLEQSLNKVIKRHEIMRTVFPKINHKLVQVVLPEFKVKLQTLDLSGLDSKKQQEKIEELMKQAKTEVFDLTSGPLFRTIGCKVSDKQYLVIFNVHHAIFDGVSVSLLIRDWMAYYRQELLPDLQSQYTDYVLEKINIPDKVRQQEINWWKECLKDAPVQSDIPSDYENAKSTDRKSGLEVLTFDSALNQQIIDFCKLHDLSKTQFILAALYLLINNITQQTDIIIGTVLNERTRETYENNIGDFNNYLPLRMKELNLNSHDELFKKVKSIFSDALSHQQVPFQELLKHVTFKRNRNQLPFYNVFLDSFNYDVIQKDVTNVKLYPFSHEITSLNLSPLMDLFFVLVQQNQELSVTCFYNQKLLKPETVKRYLSVLQDIISGFVIPSSPLSSNLPVKQSLPPQAASKVLRERIFVCIPGADGQTEIFNRLFQNGNIIVPLTKNNNQNVQDVASEIANQLKQYPTNRITLVGLSTGGIIAFEILQQLTSQGFTNVEKLILLDSPPPEKVSRTTNKIDKEILLNLIVNYMLKYFAAGKVFNRIQLNEDTKDMSYEQKEAFAYTWIKTNSLVKIPAFGQFSNWMKKIKFNLELLLAYRAVSFEKDNIKVTYLSSERVDEHPLASLEPDLFQEKINKIKAWSQLFPKIKLDVKTIENTDHFTLFQGENIPKLRAILSDTIPLSYGQERMYFAYLLDKNIPSYNCSMSFSLKGNLNIEALKKSCEELIKRHQILASVYRNTKGEVYTQMQDNQIDFEVVYSNEEQKIQKIIFEKTNKFFNLEQGPIERFTLIVKDQENYILHMAVHHIVMDGASYGILLNDLGQLYNAFAQNYAPALPALNMQYMDFSKQQRAWVQTLDAKKQLDYWQKELKDAPTYLNLPVDKERLGMPRHHMKVLSFNLSNELSQKIVHFSEKHGLSFASCFLAAYQLLLSTLSGQRDFIIGVLTSARTSLEIENLIGFFINILPIRSRLPETTSFIELVKKCGESLNKASQYQELPIEVLLNELKVARKPGENPLFQCAYVYQNYLSEQVSAWHGLNLTDFKVNNGISNDDLVLEVRPSQAGFELLIKFSTDLFYPQTTQRFANRFIQIIEEGLNKPDSQILLKQDIKNISIAANFTAEPVKESLQFWLNQLDFNVQIEFAPYNQLMQVLLEPNSSYHKNQNGINVALVRLEDWLAQSFAYPRLMKIIDEFVQAVKTYSGQPHPVLVVSICLPSPQFLEKFIDKSQYEKVAHNLIETLKQMNGVYVVEQQDMQPYWVKNYYDAITDVSAHVPYTRLYFAALGTVLARKIFSLMIQPYKVIVLDGDNTLWKGIVGEDGIQGVKVEGPYLYLQQFMLKQYNAGMLLALCTKNNEQDIEAVFQQPNNMPLQLKHFAAKQVSWQPKSQGLKQLAKELDLSLSHFIFIDDNSVEVAEVRANCPQVLALCLPNEAQKIPEFLDHLWIFDHLRVTATDKQRTELYQQNVNRERMRKQVSSFKEFINNLNLDIKIADMQPQDNQRVAQLTQRTTQFNATQIIKKESDLDENILVVNVQDRFGSYGLTGVIFYQWNKKQMIITNFLLSCRVLGKGVEHYVVSQLGHFAKAHDCKEIVFQFHSSDRNKPAKLFFQQLPAKFNAKQSCYILPVKDAIEFRFRPEDHSESQEILDSTESQYSSVNAEVMQQIGSEWVTPEKILQRLHKALLVHATPGVDYDPPKTLLEEKIANVFCQLLHVEKLSVTENFFELGVNSLMTVHAQSALAADLRQEIPLLEFFNHPSIRSLAEFLGQSSYHSHLVSGAERAMLELAARRKRNGI